MKHTYETTLDMPSIWSVGAYRNTRRMSPITRPPNYNLRDWIVDFQNMVNNWCEIPKNKGHATTEQLISEKMYPIPRSMIKSD